MERREVAGISLYVLARIKFSVEELLPFIDVAGLATEGDVNAEVVLKKLRENVSCPQSLSQTLYLDYLYNEGTDGSAWQYSKPQEASPDYLRRAFSNPDATVKNRMSKLGHRIDTDHAFFGPERSPWQ